MIEGLSRIWKDESGANLVEYGFTLALIVVGIIGSITVMGGIIRTFFTSASSGLSR